MLKSLIPLIFLILIIGSNAELKRVKLTKQKVHTGLRSPWLASTNSNLEKFPYLINAEFGDSSSKPMALVLYNPYIILSNCSKYFLNFDCDELIPENKCVPFPWIKEHYDFPFFSLWGYRMLVNMTLGGYGNGQRVKAFFADRCSAGNSFGTNQTYGSFGLAIDPTNYQNLETDGNKFSLYLGSDGSDGQLIFGEDGDLENNQTMVFVDNNVSSNWELPVLGIRLPMYKLPFNGKAIMDLYSSYIGLPDTIFNAIIAHLDRTYNFMCQPNVFFKPRCVYSGNFDSLPIIHIVTEESMLPIPPEVYITRLDDQDFQLELASLTTQAGNFGELKIHDLYKDYIILGTPFLKYYYVIFDYNDVANPRLAFYKGAAAPTPTPDEDDTGSIIVGIIIGVILLGVIGFLIYWAAKKNSERKAKEAGTLIPADQIRTGPATSTYTAYNQ